MALVNALTTLATAKLLAAVPASNTADDQLLELLINSSSSAVLRYLNRNLARATYVETYTPNARQLLILRNFPVQSITSITDQGATLVAGTDYQPDALDYLRGVVYRDLGWMPFQSFITGLVGDPISAAREIVVTYVAGYYLPGDVNYHAGDADSLPLEISQAVAQWVAFQYLQVKRGAFGLRSLTEGGLSYTWADPNARKSNGQAVPDYLADVLAAYERRVVA